MTDSSTLDLATLPRVVQVYSEALHPRSFADFVAIALIVLLSSLHFTRGIAWDRPDPHHYIYFEKPQQNEGLSSQPKATRNVAQKLEEADKDCVIFWGSQSGSAEAFAARLAKECQHRFSLKSFAADLSDYDPETIAEVPETKLVIFIISTYGEGDPSDNAAGLWDWVTKGEMTALNGLRYAAFGLGNSNYKYYNRVIDVVVERLDQHGAKRLLPVGKADDALRLTQEDFMTWKDDLFAVFRKDMDLEERTVQYQPNLHAVEDESLESIDLYQGEPAQPRDDKGTSRNSAVKPLNIKHSRELFEGGTRNCVHMELDISEHPELNYKTGDHLAIWPINPESEVQVLLRATGRESRGDIPLLLESLDSDVPVKVPAPATLNTLLRSYLEVCSPVSRDTILGLIQFAPTPEAKATILKLSQDRDSYQQLTSHTQLTLGRLLQHASPSQAWTSLPLSWVIESLPAIQPRYYSISSSSVLSPKRIAVTALVTVDELPTSILPNQPPSKIHGVTTNFLRALAAPTSISQPTDVIRYNIPTTTQPYLHAHIRKSKFKLPLAKSTPIIMVAAGTGLAPFRAFVAERAKLAASSEIGPMRLFFGCRSPEEDYIYREEFEAIQEKMDEKQAGLLKIVTAFSRLGLGEAKRYVQHRVEEEGEEVVRLLEEEGASFYICGRTVMAKEVGKRVVQAAVRCKGWDVEAAGEWLEGLKRRGKWREDVWG